MALFAELLDDLEDDEDGDGEDEVDDNNM